MTLSIRLLISFVALCLAAWPASAVDSCAKECNITFQACSKAHSQAACKTDRDICLKHCPKK